MVKSALKRQKNYRLTAEQLSKDEMKNGNVEEGRGSADDGRNKQSTVQMSRTSKEDKKWWLDTDRLKKKMIFRIQEV